MQSPIYLDHASSSPMLPEALEAMMPFFIDNPGNASSQHSLGRIANEAVDEARSQVASLIGADSDRIYFTSGGTEADNWAVKSVFDSPATARRLLYSPTEHAAVIESVSWLREHGVSCEPLSVDRNGVVLLDELRQKLNGNPALVSIMHVNNESGVIQPIQEAAQVCHAVGATLHVDGVQATRWIDIDVNLLDADTYAVSSHKIGGPKGVGALYVRRGLRIPAIMHGGSQENGRRGGTINVPGVVGFGCAAHLTMLNRQGYILRTEPIRNMLELGLTTAIPELLVTSQCARRVSNMSHVTMQGIEGESLLIALDFEGIAASAGAACSSGSTEPSHVLLAMGMEVARARSAVRFSFGPNNDESQVMAVLTAMERSVEELRSLS